MNVIAHYQTSKNSNHPCPELTTMAARELAAFFNAITQLFGPEQADLSAEDWLRELIKVGDLPTSTREWRLITAKASTRLARRVSASSLSSRRSSLPSSPRSSSRSTEAQFA
jgi:hypothetical protein